MRARIGKAVFAQVVLMAVLLLLVWPAVRAAPPAAGGPWCLSSGRPL